MRISEICNRETIVVEGTSNLLEAAQTMRHHHVGSVVVVDRAGPEAKPIGILTDRDLVVEVLAAEVAPETITVKDVMSSDLVVAHEEDDLWETIQRIRTKGIRRLPVVNKKGFLVGIVTVDDVLELLAEAFNDLAALVRRGQRREEARRA